MGAHSWNFCFRQYGWGYLLTSLVRDKLKPKSLCACNNQ